VLSPVVARGGVVVVGGGGGGRGWCCGRLVVAGSASVEGVGRSR